jgi:hypothetical protein
MFAGIGTRPEQQFLALGNAVFCLDCEVISNGQGDECPACRSRSLVNLARMLGGSLLSQKLNVQNGEVALFDIKVTIELLQMRAKDFNTMLEDLTKVIWPKLARAQACLHVSVEPAHTNSSFPTAA